MRYAWIVVGVIVFDLILMAIRFKMSWLNGFWPNFGGLMIWTAIAFFLAKTIRFPNKFYTPMCFRNVVIILSMVFGTILANTSIVLTQRAVFGQSEVAYFDDPLPKPGSSEKTIVRTIPEKMVINFVSSASEEVLYRWIILGALCIVMPPGWAIFISSLIFGLMHTPMRIMAGFPLGGVMSVAPTFFIGVFCGIAFIRYGLGAAIAIHFLVNLVSWFAYNNTYIADTVIFGSAAIALILLPLTLWFTKKKSPTSGLIG